MMYSSLTCLNVAGLWNYHMRQASICYTILTHLDKAMPACILQMVLTAQHKSCLHALINHVWCGAAGAYTETGGQTCMDPS